jgi:4-hydroxybenzoate polyprenyltransferase
VANGAQPDRAGSLHPDAAPGLERKTLVTVQDPVFDPDGRSVLAKAGELVDMEGFAVAEVCRELHIPCCLIKGVTDFGDRNGKTDILEHLDSVSAKVAERVLQTLARRAVIPGALMPKVLRFTRVEHTLFSLPLLFAGAWLGAGGHCPPIMTLALIALVGAGARTFGMAINRIVDRDIDARNPRTAQRELPTGRLSLFQGYAIAAAGLAAYLLGCALLGRTVLLLAFIPLVPLALYSYLKRFTCLCHYGIGVCLALAPLGAFVAVSNSLAFTPEVWLLALFTFCWISGFDIIYALLDIEFDRTHSVRSLPAALGPVRAQCVAALTHLISMAALICLWYSTGGWMSGAALLVALGTMTAAYWQKIPVHIRFFPLSAIAGIAGALVVLMKGLP